MAGSLISKSVGRRIGTKPQWLLVEKLRMIGRGVWVDTLATGAEKDDEDEEDEDGDEDEEDHEEEHNGENEVGWLAGWLAKRRPARI